MGCFVVIIIVKSNELWGTFLLLIVFFPMFLFDPHENIRKPKISYPLIRTRTCAYQGVRNIGFSDAFRGNQKPTLGAKWLKQGIM